MARKSRYMGYVEGLEQLKSKHEKRRKIGKEKEKIVTFLREKLT